MLQARRTVRKVSGGMSKAWENLRMISGVCSIRGVPCLWFVAACSWRGRFAANTPDHAQDCRRHEQAVRELAHVTWRLLQTRQTMRKVWRGKRIPWEIMRKVWRALLKVRRGMLMT
ncbi:MAG: hypothetical protein A2107_15795 [Verrucomicrobia bacterium GWF2_62_7]|nr:MAG: hypothetical protein A2107_15795 [Verrucomicrobia bacterium GWF2_62_7]